MKRIHVVSGCIITLFVLVHLTNHATRVIGSDKHLHLMSLLRHFYRHPIAESILLAAVSFQIFTGLQLFKATRSNNAATVDTLHRWTGLYLAFFLVIHVSAVLAGRLLLKLDTNFYFGVAGLNSFPINLFFIPYYAFAILSFFGHLACIHAKKMKRNLVGLTPIMQAKAIGLVGLVVVLILFYGLTNRFQGVALPDEYKVLIGK